ncbi:MAG: hypothetical protein F4Z85_06155 [Gemmatimonadetes bacterium]|nr:hypothetical protein [Gemmatimonadota bacterium]MYB69197.1 hypothetical protein [Gemmatimonadota bacterium]
MEKEMRMMSKHSKDVIDRVRAIRREISEEVGNDPEELVRHYQELDEKYRARLLRGKVQESED